MLTRRDLLELAGLLAAPLSAATNGSGDRVYECQYRARATVLMLSLPLLHRDNVGGGYLRINKREEGGKRHWRFEFGAGSLPERAAGLNRLGIFEETIVESAGRIESATYFGFMTASNEKNLEQARSALHAGGAQSFSAIGGRVERGRIWNRLLRISDAETPGWAAREKLTAQIPARLAESSSPVEQIGQEDSCGAFLSAINAAMWSEEPVCTHRFIHNGKIHRLRTERKGANEIEGRIQSQDGKDLSTFQLWFEANQTHRYPLRFEFRPRSFLRLTFERV